MNKVKLINSVDEKLFKNMFGEYERRQTRSK